VSESEFEFGWVAAGLGASPDVFKSLFLPQLESVSNTATEISDVLNVIEPPREKSTFFTKRKYSKAKATYFTLCAT